MLEPGTRSHELVTTVKKQMAPFRGTAAYKSAMALCAVHEEMVSHALILERVVHDSVKAKEKA